jgi:uncharacterized membrane protein
VDARDSKIAIVGIALAAFVISAYFYPRLPETVASHWSAQGQANGYMSRLWFLVLVPLILSGLAFLFMVIPRIDPLKVNIEKFRKHYDRFAIVVLGFILYTHLLSIYWNLGTRFNMVQLLSPAFGVLLYCSGTLTENAERNWFVGIRTPWTLSNEDVWKKTHKIGGKLLKLSGLIALLGIVFPDLAMAFVLVPVISGLVYAVLYSYILYQRQGVR